MRWPPEAPQYLAAVTFGPPEPVQPPHRLRHLLEALLRDDGNLLSDKLRSTFEPMLSRSRGLEPARSTYTHGTSPQ